MMECWATGEPHGGLTFEEKISVHTVLVELISDANMQGLPLSSLPAFDFADRLRANAIMAHHANMAASASQSALDKRKAETIRDATSQRIRIQRQGQFHYALAPLEQSRIQTLINELREIIGASSIYEESHKRRLLLRLEVLQGELHKKLADLDRFWGLIGDAGVAIGKFGKDVKPVVDRIREITQIVWNRQAETEGLPPPTDLPRLPSPDETNV